ANLRAWVLTIASRKAIDHVRARSRRAVPLGEAGELAETAPACTAESDGAIWTRVAQLPDKQRTAVALRFVADAAYDEIAAVMRTSEAAAGRNAHEGHKKLREESADD